MILTVISGRNEDDWFDIDVPDECSVERLNELLGLRLFREPSRGRCSIYIRSKISGRFVVYCKCSVKPC